MIAPAVYRVFDSENLVGRDKADLPIFEAKMLPTCHNLNIFFRHFERSVNVYQGKRVRLVPDLDE